MKRSAFAGFAVTLSIALVACSNAPTSPSAVTTTGAPLGGAGTRNTLQAISPTDFVSFAASMNQAEIELGMMAEQRGDLPQVKNFARQMVQDHTNALASLRTAASDASNAAGSSGSNPSIFVPSNITLSATDQQTRTQLSQLSGSAFDPVYISAMIRSHQDALTRFQEQAASGSSSIIRDWAQGQIPSLQAHLRLAQDLATRVGVATNGTTTTGTSGGSSGGSGSSGGGGSSGGSSGGTNGSTNNFINFAAAMNQAEIELGMLAEQRADLPEVKAFGLQMVEDHTAAQASLRAAAGDASSASVPTGSSPSIVFPSNITLSATDQQTRTQLSQLSGSAFDPVFISAMIASHQAAIAQFQQQAASGSSSFIRNYAAGVLTSLQAHLRLAQDLATRVGVSNSTR